MPMLLETLLEETFTTVASAESLLRMIICAIESKSLSHLGRHLFARTIKLIATNRILPPILFAVMQKLIAANKTFALISFAAAINIVYENNMLRHGFQEATAQPHH